MMIRKIDCIICNNHRNLRSPKISFIFDKTLGLSIICNTCSRNDEKSEILKTTGLINNNEWVIYTKPYVVYLS